MVKYKQFKQDNGLSVIHHQDTTSGIVVFNLMYHVGSKHESPDKTGLAHFLEHMMFEGSKNVPKFDRALAESGGSSNAIHLRQQLVHLSLQRRSVSSRVRRVC